MSLTEKNIRNIFIYILPRFFKYGIYLFALPILTRHLTPKDFGVISLAWAFPTIAVSIVTSGLTASITRYYFEYRNDSKKLNMLYFSVQFYLFLMFAISIPVVYMTQHYIAKLVIGKTDYGMAVFIVYLAVYMDQINTFFLRIYQNMEKAVVHSAFVMLQAVVSITASMILVLYFKMSYMGMIYGSFSGALISCLTISFYFNRHVQINFSKDILLENLKYGLQVVPESFTGIINKYFDKYMLNAMLSMSAAGIYNIGQTVSNTLFVLMSTVWKSFQPVYYREVFDKGDDASAEVGRIFTVFTYITLLPIVLVILFAQEILYILAPPSYYGAIDVLVVLAAGTATQTFAMYIGVQFAYKKRPFWIFPVSVIGTIMNVVLNIILIPRYGLIGAGFATIGSVTAINLVLTYIGQKLYEIKYEWKMIVPLFINIIAAMIAILFLRSNDFSNLIVYITKGIFLISFVLIGIRAEIITKHSIGKICNVFYNLKKKEA